jgi:hypothetical protein
LRHFRKHHPSKGKQAQYSHGGFGGRRKTQLIANSSSVEKGFKQKSVGGGSGGEKMGGFRFTSSQSFSL